MPEPSRNVGDSLYVNLSPTDRERALANLDRYFEIVLQIFMRTQANHQQDAHSPAIDDSFRFPKLETKGRFFNK